MNLHDALTLLADRLQVPVDDLIAYADEDQMGGRGVGFNAYALDRDEGRLLYAVIRALKPKTVLEIGVYEGASTSHLLAAVAENGGGHVVSYDTYAEAGNGIPDDLRDRWEFVNANAAVRLPALTAQQSADVVYEDGDHSLDGATATYREIVKMNPIIVIAHDYNMTTEHGDFHVKEAFDAVFFGGFNIVLDGCERGLGVWINVGRIAGDAMQKTAVAIQQTVEAFAEAKARLTPEPKQPAVKKPPARKPSAKK